MSDPAAPAPMSTAYALVQQQAEDDGLWFRAETCAEAYVQQELRKLHSAVEQDHENPRPTPTAQPDADALIRQHGKCVAEYERAACEETDYALGKAEAALRAAFAARDKKIADITASYEAEQRMHHKCAQDYSVASECHENALRLYREEKTRAEKAEAEHAKLNAVISGLRGKLLDVKAERDAAVAKRNKLMDDLSYAHLTMTGIEDRAKAAEAREAALLAALKPIVADDDPTVSLADQRKRWVENMDRARATLTNLPALSRGDMVRVPREPDLTMCNHGFNQINPMMENAEGIPMARRVYRAMIAAAQEKPHDAG